MESLIAIAGLVALVWGAVVFCRGGLLGGCLAVLLCGCCFGSAWFRLPTDPIPLTLDRALWLALMVQYVFWRRWGLADPKALGKPDVLLFVFFGVLFASTFAHDWQSQGAAPAARLLFFWIMPLGMYWVARQSVLTERGGLAIFGGLALFGIYLAITALAETRQLGWLAFPRYIVSPEYPEFLGRARGPLLNPVGCGLFQVVCLSSLLLWWPRLGRRGQLLLLGLAGLITAGIWSTLTRSVWIGAGAGMLIMAGAALPRGWRMPALGCALLVGAVVVASGWERFLAFKRDRNLDAQAAAESVELRPVLAMVAWKMFLDRPLAGCGFGQYLSASRDYVSDRSTDLVLEKAAPYVQHNTFLALLTETGLPGAALFVAVLVLWSREAWRLWRTPTAPLWVRQTGLLLLVLTSNYAINAMFHDVSIIAMVNMLLFFLAGVTTGLRGKGEWGGRNGEWGRGDAVMG
ncbi:MAG: O-antigen ligase family protein [Pirellulales bacterium]|nr:O-antigen ligase family protein [Pirellulales bacterium]